MLPLVIRVVMKRTGGERSKTLEKQVIHNKIAHHPLTNTQSIPEQQ